MKSSRGALAACALAVLLAQARSAEQGSVQFVDVAAAAGVVARNRCGAADAKRYTLEVTGSGCAFLDYDRDGSLDILLVQGSTLEAFRRGGDPMAVLYRNVGKGRFTDATAAAGLRRTGWGMGVAVADVDNDGLDDVYITGFGGNVLYRNAGNGTFTDATDKAGLRDGGWSTGAAFADYDSDGWVDLAVVHYLKLDLDRLPEYGSTPLCRYRGIPVHCGPKGLAGETPRLYRNNRDGTFRDATLETGLGSAPLAYGFSALWTDYDDDGHVDLYVANDSTPNFLFHNRRGGKFTEVGLETGAGVSEDGREQAGMGVDAGDFDGDGRMDLFVTNFSDDYYTLYRQEPDGTFADVSTRAGIGTATWNHLGWGTGFLDYDNDGRLDLFCANGHIYPEVDRYDFGTRYRQRNQLLRSIGGGRFADLGATAGPGMQVVKSSRGAAFGDYDGDGDTDILVVNLDDTPTLLENRGGNRRRWIGFELEGVRSNRGAIGARVRVRAAGRVWTAEVRGGGSYISSNDRRVRIGLGDAAAVEAEIRWPGGEVQRFDKLATGRYYRLKEGEKPVPLR